MGISILGIGCVETTVGTDCEFRVQPDRCEVRTSEGYSIAAISIRLMDRLHTLIKVVARVSCIISHVKEIFQTYTVRALDSSALLTIPPSTYWDGDEHSVMADKIYIAQVVLVPYITHGQIEVDNAHDPLDSLLKRQHTSGQKESSPEINDDHAVHLSKKEIRHNGHYLFSSFRRPDCN